MTDYTINELVRSVQEVQRSQERLLTRIEALEFVRVDVYMSDEKLRQLVQNQFSQWQENHDEKHSWLLRSLSGAIVLTLVNAVVALLRIH